MRNGGTKAGIVDTKAYISCPASVVDGVLQFDGSDLDIQAQDASSSVRLEGYTSDYCYLNDGEYYRLIPLDDLKSVVEIDKEFPLPGYYYVCVQHCGGNLLFSLFQA